MARIPTQRLTALTSALALAFAAGAQAQTADAPAAANADAGAVQQLDAVTITQGRGQVRSVQGLDGKDFAEAPAGQSPLVTISRLPGVNFQSADPLGNYEWSARITLRSFAQNQLGFTLDNVPLGDMSYGNFNGLHISRAISAENVGRALVSQGSGSLDTASSSNLGGTVQFYSRDPARTFGVDLRQTLGSDDETRTFARVDLGETGVGRFALSVMSQDASKWKGEGKQRQSQVNLKYVDDLSADTRVSAFVNTSQRREIDYQDMSLAMIQRLGYDWDNYYPNFGAALTAAKTLCGNNGTTYVAQCDDAYYAGAGLRNDVLAGATLDTRITEQLHANLTVYGHTDKGDGLWFTPYTTSPDGTPIALRTTEYRIHRSGEIGNFDLELGEHTIKFGLWHETNHFDQARRFYAVSPTAVPSPYDFPSNPFATQWQYRFRTNTNQFWLGDTWTATRQLTLTAGFKSLAVSTDGEAQVSSGNPSGTVESKKNFLPQAGLNYQLTASDELFAEYARNMRAFQAAATGTTPWATTQAGFDAIKGTLKPETSDTFEGGWRTQGKLYQGSLTAYLVNFHDRLLAVQPGSGIQGNPVVLSNVGGVRSYGLEAALSLRLMPNVNWFNSLSESSSKYNSDIVSGGTTYATAGKRVVDAPSTMLRSILGYDDGRLFGDFGVDYMSRRYYSYTNDASVPGRTLLNLSAGYRFPAMAYLKASSVQLNVTNLGDVRYISTLGSNGFVNTDPNGTAQTLLPGAPREFTVTFAGKF
ncbi:MAG: TonB-dependent receptor [Pelomonas sp.]|nr:TonB-dependent receptor [Roseateles sp.]